MKTMIAFLLLLVLLAPNSALAVRTSRLEIVVFGSGPKSVDFSGWCEIETGDGKLVRENFSGRDDQLKPVVLPGVYFDRCAVNNDSNQGSVTLLLRHDGKEFYQRTTAKGEMAIHYGPTMKRFSTKPHRFIPPEKTNHKVRP